MSYLKTLDDFEKIIIKVRNDKLKSLTDDFFFNTQFLSDSLIRNIVVEEYVNGRKSDKFYYQPLGNFK